MYASIRLRLNWALAFFSSLRRAAISIFCCCCCCCKSNERIGNCSVYLPQHVYFTVLWLNVDGIDVRRDILYAFRLRAMIKSTNQCICAHACNALIDTHVHTRQYARALTHTHKAHRVIVEHWALLIPLRVCTLQFFANVFYILIFRLQLNSISTYQKRIISSVNLCTHSIKMLLVFFLLFCLSGHKMKCRYFVFFPYTSTHFWIEFCWISTSEYDSCKSIALRFRNWLEFAEKWKRNDFFFIRLCLWLHHSVRSDVAHNGKKIEFASGKLQIRTK